MDRANKTQQMRWYTRWIVALATLWTLSKRALNISPNANALPNSTIAPTSDGIRAPVPWDGARFERLRDYNPTGLKEAIETALQQSVWVQRAITATADALAMVPWMTEVRNEEGVWVRADENHPAEKLRRSPNDLWGFQTLIQYIAAQLYTSGNCLVVKTRNRKRRVLELWTLYPPQVWVVKSRTRLIAGYVFIDEIGQRRALCSDDAIHLMIPDPTNLRWGLSPLQSARRAINADLEISEAQSKFTENAMSLGGILSLPDNVTEDDDAALVQTLEDDYEGSTNAGKTLIINTDAKYQRVSSSPQEMDFIESQRLTREVIAAAFGIPQPLLGILDRANYSNSKALRESWWVDTLTPRLESIKDTLNRQLVQPEFGPGVRWTYSTSNLDALVESTQIKIQNAERLFRMGYSANAINADLALGLTETDAGELELIPGNLIPAAQLVDDPVNAL